MPRVTSNRRLPAIVSAMLLVASVAAQERPLPDRETFLQETRTRLASDHSLQSRYTYVETRRQRKLDDQGRPEEESVKVFESHPGLPGEDGRWERLIVEDGRPVSPAALAKQDRERQQKVEALARRLASAPQRERAGQHRAWEKHRRETAEAVEDVFRVYDIRMLGRERIDGHDTIAFSLQPRPDADPRTDDGQIMRHFTVHAWISESDYELVRVEAEAIETVSIAFGLLARVHPGARFSFTRRKVDGDAWLPAVSSYSGSARVGLVKVVRRSSTSEFSNYRRVGEASSAGLQRDAPTDSGRSRQSAQ